MKKLSEEKVLVFLKEALEVARSSSCLSWKCGTIIVKDGEIIGRGFNSPPGDLECSRRCENSKKDYDEKVTDKTCCVHAEQRAMLDVLANNPKKLEGSSLYFVRLDKDGNNKFSKQPYCTICSKMALDLKIKEVVLWHKDGVFSYESLEYNDLSYGYKED